MEKTIQLIKEFFDNGKWKYDYFDEKKEFRSGIVMNDVVGNLSIRIFVKPNHYTVYVYLRNQVDSDHRNSVSEYLHRANYGLRNGNFEFDFDDGEIRYKTFVNFDKIGLSPDVVEESIIVPILMFDMYGKNLFRLLLDDGIPKDLIADAEKRVLDDHLLPDSEAK